MFSRIENSKMVRSTLLQHGVQGAPTGKIRGLLTQSMFKGKMPRDLSHQKSNESLSLNHIRNFNDLENWKFEKRGSYNFNFNRIRGFNFGHFLVIFGHLFEIFFLSPENRCSSSINEYILCIQCLHTRMQILEKIHSDLTANTTFRQNDKSQSFQAIVVVVVVAE